MYFPTTVFGDRALRTIILSSTLLIYWVFFCLTSVLWYSRSRRTFWFIANQDLAILCPMEDDYHRHDTIFLGAWPIFSLTYVIYWIDFVEILWINGVSAVLFTHLWSLSFNFFRLWPKLTRIVGSNSLRVKSISYTWSLRINGFHSV